MASKVVIYAILIKKAGSFLATFIHLPLRRSILTYSVLHRMPVILQTALANPSPLLECTIFTYVYSRYATSNYPTQIMISNKAMIVKFTPLKLPPHLTGTDELTYQYELLDSYMRCYRVYISFLSVFLHYPSFACCFSFLYNFTLGYILFV